MADAPASIALNPRAQIQLRRTGREGHPLLIVDDVLNDPDVLVEQAVHAAWAPPHHTNYPGLNAPLPDAYGQAILAAVRPILARGFGLPGHLPLSLFGFFALATQAPGDLAPIQKIPHRDSSDPFQIALVHYLCRDQAGGTAFFRHKASGFESVDARRAAGYDAASAAELAEGPDLPRHVDEATPGFEQVDFAPIAFNRLVAYRSHVLHSGLLNPARLGDDPRTGRLTANCFITVAAQ